MAPITNIVTADDEVSENCARHSPTVGKPLPYRVVKRLFDVVFSLCVIAVGLIPGLILSVFVAVDTKGSPIYSQERVGRGGRPFRVYKFRSMYADAEERGARWAVGDDPRVTPFGRWMRDHRVDEVPQFLNVVRGDMSLIGPRPERPAFCEAFEERIHGWRYRTKVRPGLSGLAQVSGGYDLLPAEKVVLDLEYIRTRSIAMDAKLILRTLGVLGSGEGAR